MHPDNASVLSLHPFVDDVLLSNKWQRASAEVANWLRLWCRVLRKTAFPWWKPETVPDALCTSSSSSHFDFCTIRKPDFRLGSKTGSTHIFLLTIITILPHIKVHLIFSLFRHTAEPENFRFAQQNYLQHTILFAFTRFSNELRSDWIFDYSVEFFFPVGILKFN